MPLEQDEPLPDSTRAYSTSRTVDARLGVTCSENPILLMSMTPRSLYPPITFAHLLAAHRPASDLVIP